MVHSLGGPFGVAVFASIFAARTATHAREIISRGAAQLGIDPALLRGLPRLQELAKRETSGLSPEQLKLLALFREIGPGSRSCRTMLVCTG
ncbi:MAG: hypothetical protein C4570_07085 [Ammonifex sp.]|nr:MAG: hypothetical protein C4570_07085 [Ammonifex sp.]